MIEIVAHVLIPPQPSTGALRAHILRDEIVLPGPYEIRRSFARIEPVCALTGGCASGFVKPSRLAHSLMPSISG